MILFIITMHIYHYHLLQRNASVDYLPIIRYWYFALAMFTDTNIVNTT